MIEYRLASEKDLSGITELEKILFSDSWTQDSLSQFFHTPFARCYVGVLDEKVICYALCTLILGEGEILRIGTLPEYRRQGLAKKLLSLYFEDARKDRATKIFLEVREQNLAARTLYESVGFSLSGRRKAYYSSPKEDAVLYQIEPNKELKL